MESSPSGGEGRGGHTADPFLIAINQHYLFLSGATTCKSTMATQAVSLVGPCRFQQLLAY
ncbi:unnamed protein product [Prunus armeniaca]|uniref:Uncharacterized protein n=1 Tax=Prunus armeniaca TaxID=36596 RepID=A0A6J5UWK4_PRUAR|nr:unnamed protein product [Prunus armeniaca]CAB4310707.1 unnamed protein product [Prunus armeniaca]